MFGFDISQNQANEGLHGSFKWNPNTTPVGTTNCDRKITLAINIPKSCCVGNSKSFLIVLGYMLSNWMKTLASSAISAAFVRHPRQQ